MRTRLSVVLMLLAALSVSATAQKPSKSKKKDKAAALPAVIWRDPGAASLNLLYGAGGKEDAPNPEGTFTFEREDLAETSLKFDVVDDQHVQWRVKLGAEPQSETAATRLLWAAGFFVDEDYYLPELKVAKLPTLQRGQEFVSQGIVHKARLERRTKERKKLGSWDWFDNPFAGTRELNGLRVMMSLLNNWDLSTLNNSIYETNGERQYAVSDAGATFGDTGNNFTRSKSVPKDYAASKFVEKAAPDFVDFVLHSRPFLLGAVEVNNYRDRTRMEQVTKHIPRADAVWLGQRLSRLSEEQIRDAFRAAGYAPAEIEMLTQTVRKRIADLEVL
jgi:hypothetical protein